MKMLSHTYLNKNNSRLKRRRGVTDVISTMLLMAVTVTGATTLTYFVNDEGEWYVITMVHKTTAKICWLSLYCTHEFIMSLSVEEITDQYKTNKKC